MAKDSYNFKNVKLVALDLDGTLLNNHLGISQRTKETLKGLYNRGIKIALVSGRPYKAADLVREDLDIDIPIVAYNGGRIIIPGGKEVFTDKIPLKEALKVIRYGEERDLYVKVYIDDVLYIKEPDKRSIDFSKSRNINYKVVGKLSENIKEDVNMIIIYYNEDINGAIDDELRDVDAAITTSAPFALDVIPKGISKGKALKMIAELLNIKRENILAMGNSFNDIDMLKYAGIGIAVKNSDISLLKEWDNVSSYTNNEDAVYHAINEI
ncbi:Cof-type HAD-IIB family hydrolase [Candidatus Clostridium stratigraminis]|uniref:Cof-type HAD-IIB family hydrolase n=1 Tax=Candidatus Clostridium stratigraminis TaxID=3381661 RepID=A0ABW8T5A9_9CLOT